MQRTQRNQTNNTRKTVVSSAKKVTGQAKRLFCYSSGIRVSGVKNIRIILAADVMPATENLNKIKISAPLYSPGINGTILTAEPPYLKDHSSAIHGQTAF